MLDGLTRWGEEVLSEAASLAYLMWRELGWLGTAAFLMIPVLFVGMLMLRGLPPPRPPRRKAGEEPVVDDGGEI